MCFILIEKKEVNVRMVSTKTLFPTDFRDYLALISLFGFFAIFLEFALNNPLLSEKMTPVFMLVGGAGMLVAGKIFSIKQWTKDGLQPGEFGFVIALVTGFSSIIIGVLLFAGVVLQETFRGWVGFIALIPIVFILIDYWQKNK